LLKQSHFLRSIFVCVDPFKEAAEAERNGGEKRAQKSKVIKIDSQKSWEHHISHATNKKYPASLFSLYEFN